MTDVSGTPAGMSVSTPNIARMYDYYLGGKDNYRADREAADKVIAVLPEARRAAQDSRAFLGRAVRFLAGEAGVKQFIDIGTGLPTQGNVHEVAQEVAPDARVVYVDNDPVVLAHARALLANNDTVQVIEADMRRPEDIVGNPVTRDLIDFDQPVAVLLVAILHFVTEEQDPYAIVDALRKPMAPGSHLVVSHAAGESRPRVVPSVTKVYEEATAPIVPRDHEQIARFFAGLELLDPGLVYVRQWRAAADDEVGDPTGSLSLAGVGRVGQ